MKYPESTRQVLDLRMNSLFLGSINNTNACHSSDFDDQIKTLMSQDRSYYGDSNSINGINASDREKMVQWEYRIVDHFGCSRDLVGIAFSFLDRFTAKCACDRQAYKLAAMTSLLIAMKLHNPRQFSIGTLAALSRGEFNTTHIAQMEMKMLRALDWRLSPPTTQSFIHRWGEYLVEEGKAIESIERAIFLAEIAIFDTLLVSKERALVAIAALLDGVSCDLLKKQTEASILRKMENDFGVSYTQEEIYVVRDRLLYIYSKTSESLAEYNHHSDPMAQECNARIEKGSSSGVAISGNATKKKNFQHSPRSVRGRCEQGY